jgi:hypothetical protein
MSEDEERAMNLLKSISEDTSVPRNIRRSAVDALSALNNVEQEPSPAIRANIATSILQETSLDPNCPVHARTLIWTVISILEIIQDDDDDDGTGSQTDIFDDDFDDDEFDDDDEDEE